MGWPSGDVAEPLPLPADVPAACAASEVDELLVAPVKLAPVLVEEPDVLAPVKLVLDTLAELVV